MNGESLSSAQSREVQHIAELETRRYFDHYLNEVWPAQQKALREHTHLMIEKHDADDRAHGGVEKKVHRIIWMILGAVAAGGLGGAGLTRLLLTLA